jgi:hypothetical protein
MPSIKRSLSAVVVTEAVTLNLEPVSTDVLDPPVTSKDND